MYLQWKTQDKIISTTELWIFWITNNTMEYQIQDQFVVSDLQTT